jgi:transcriptional regulator with XRE-family HTH domain
VPRSTPGDPDGAGGEGPGKSLAHKLDHLFRTIHPAGRGEYSLDEVAEGIRRRGVSTISSTYIWELRKGLKDNPTKRHLEALADFFGVSPLYFFDDEIAERTDAQLDLLAALRDADVRHLALRAAVLSPQTVRVITELIEHARALEGIPDGAGGPGAPDSPRPRRRQRPAPPPPRRRTTQSPGASPPPGPRPDG